MLVNINKLGQSEQVSYKGEGRGGEEGGDIMPCGQCMVYCYFQEDHIVMVTSAPLSIWLYFNDIHYLSHKLVFSFDGCEI